MDVGNQFDNCSLELKVEQLQIANLVDVITNAVSFFLLLFLLALLVLHKAFKTTIQRLFLCLTVATGLNAMVTTLNIELQFDNDPELKFCEFIGFFNTWMGNLIELFSLAFTVYLISTTYQRFKGQEMSCLETCRKHPVVTEIICVLMIAFFPLSYLWVPLVRSAYGLSGTLCVMKIKYCKEGESDVEYVIFGILMLSLHLAVTLSFAILIAVISMNIVRVQYSRKESLGTIKRAVFLIVAISITLCIRIAQFAVNMSINFHHATTPEYRYIAFNNTLYSITNLMVPLGFAVYLYSPKKLGIKSLKKAAKEWKCYKHREAQRHRIRYKNIGDDDGLVSIQHSLRQDSPSQTTGYSPCYTNEFTDITENVSMSSPKYGTLRTHGLQ